MFSKIVLVCLLAAAVLADVQDQQQQQQQLDSGEKQENTVVRRTVNKNIVDYTEKVQQSQPFWQQYRPVIGFTRDAEGIQKTVRLPGNPYFQGIRVNVRPYPGGYVAIRTNGAEIVKPLTSSKYIFNRKHLYYWITKIQDERAKRINSRALFQTFWYELYTRFVLKN